MRITTGILSFILLCCVVTSAFGAVVYVKQDSPGPVFDGASWETAFHSVQAGVDAAASGSEVWVAAGNYAESVNLKTGISLLGGYSGVDSVRDIKANVSKIISCAIVGSSTLEGFTVEGATESAVSCSGAGMCVVRSNNISGTQTHGVYAMSAALVEKNIITNSATAALDYGVYSMSTTLCRISANRISGQNTGISCAAAYVYNNIVSNAGTGILGNGASVHILNNLVCDNSVAGIALGQTGESSNNIVLRNGYGIENRSVNAIPVTDNNVYANRIDYSPYVMHNTSNISVDPMFENPEAGDYRLLPGSPCLNKGSTSSLSGKSITTDINGLPRVYASVVDIGPCEFQAEERICASPSNSLVCVMEPGVSSSASQTYTLYNIGTQSISWNAAKTADWVSLSAASGSILPGQSATINVSINGNASGLFAGRWSDVITFFTSPASETFTRGVSLIVGSIVHVDSQANGIVHDGTSWPTAYKTINEAIDVALPGQEIRVAKGTYREYLLIRKNVTLKGGYNGLADVNFGNVRDIASNETIIEKPSGYGDTVIFESPCAIDGFTITKGYDGVWGAFDSTIALTSCTFKNNTNSGVTLQYANGTVSRCKATENRYGLVLYSNLCTAVNNLVYKNSSYGMNMQNSAIGINNTCVSNGENGIYNTVASPGSVNNLVFGNYTNYADATGTIPSDPGPDPLFVDPAADNYHLAMGSPCIDAGTSVGAPTIDLDGYPRPINSWSENGLLKWDIGCYEAPSFYTNPAKLKVLPNGSAVRLENMVSTAALPDRIYVQTPGGVSGIGVMGNGAPSGHYVSVDGVLTTINGERLIKPTFVKDDGAAPMPKPKYMNHKSLGGGARGLQAGAQEWRYVTNYDEFGNSQLDRKLINFSGVNNIGLLVKMTGRVTGRLNIGGTWSFILSSDQFDLGPGVKVSWPFDTEPPASGALVSIVGISSCSVIPDEQFGDVLWRLLRPVSVESVVVH